MSDYYPATNNIPAPACEHRDKLYGNSPSTSSTRDEVIDELIDDTVWMDAWARDFRQQERMTQSRKTIIQWLESKKSNDDESY